MARLWTAITLHIMLYYSISLTASAASMQISMNKAANAVAGTIAGNQLEHNKLGTRKKGLDDCVLKYMSELSPAEQPDDPCFFDTGAGTALRNTVGRGLLQGTPVAPPVPNYAVPAGTSRSPTPGLSPSINQNPSGASSPLAPGTSSPQNQNPFAPGSASPALASTAASTADDVSAATTVNGGGDVIRDKPARTTGLPPPVPQPAGPDPQNWQQTADFPEGTRLTIDQADRLLSGNGFH